jgi:tRNA (guanine37-N1)-methyltransferase
MDPDGKKFDQKMAKQFSQLDNLVLICGRYEGFDERIYKFVDEKISVGEYVLAGGELPALTITEATARLLSGVLGNEKSLEEETFAEGFIEYSQYTRPEDFMGLKVPKILLSGDHEKIKEWRRKNTKK